MNLDEVQRGPQQRPQKVLIYGVEGIGKSTLAGKFPAPIFLDCEDRTAHLNVERLIVKNWQHLDDMLDVLHDDDHKYRTCVLDTADWAENMARQDVCLEHSKSGIEDFGYGKGWKYVTERMNALLQKFHLLQYKRGMHIVILAHAKIKRFDDPQLALSYDRYELKCSDSVSALIREWSDCVLFANYQVLAATGADKVVRAKAGRERYLHCAHTAAFDAKNSWGLPDEIPMEYAELKPYIEIGFNEHITYAPEPGEESAAKTRYKKLAMDLANSIGQGKTLLNKMLKEKGVSYKQMTLEECEYFVDEVRARVTTILNERTANE